MEGHAHWVNTLALSTDYVMKTGMVPLPPFNNAQSIIIKCYIHSLIYCIFHFPIKFFLGDDILAEAKRRYNVAVAGGGERLISGSDDFTLFLWSPESSKNSVGNKL